MRFRVLNNGGQQAADGVGNFFRSLAMAPMYEAQAADAAQQEQAKRSLIGAQTEQANANTRLIGAKAANEADLTQRRGLSGMIADAAMANGVAPYQVPDFVKYAQTGQMPSRYSPPPVDGVGPYEPAPAIYQDDTASKIWKMLGLNNQTLAFDRGNVADVAKASGEYRDQSLGDSVLSGAANPGMVAQSQAAVAGKPLINNIGNTGAGFNQFTGEGQTLNPGMLALFGDQGRQGIALDKAREGASVAQAGASKASAASSYASAARHRAATDKLRMEISQGGSTGQVQVVPAVDGSVMLVDKRTGQARPAIGPDGAPVQGKGPPVKALPSSAAKGFLDNMTNLRRAETALSLVNGDVVGDATGDKNATGWKGLMPNSILNRVDPSGVDTRAAIADLGSLVIHDRSGAAVTASEFPRLAPFVPTAYDDPATVKKKLSMFVQNYRAIIDDSAEFYRQSGYTVPGNAGANNADPTNQGPTPDPLGLRR